MAVSRIDLALWSLEDTVVLREWENVDLLLVSEANRLVVVIENKLGTGEHSNQLARYHERIRQHYPGHTLVPLYLTPEGDAPSDERYLPVGYGLIVDLLDQLLQGRASVMGTDLQVLLRHYIELLRTHVVSNSDIDDLCRRIYQKHQRALDLIFERRPDRQAQIKELLEELIRGTPGLELDHSSKVAIHFAPSEWDVPPLLEGEGWMRSRRIMLFFFDNKPDGLTLRLYIGPGPIETRERLFRAAASHQPPFKVQSGSLNKQWNRIYIRSFLSRSKLEESSLEDLEAETRDQWAQFVDRDLESIRGIFRAEPSLGIAEV